LSWRQDGNSGCRSTLTGSRDRQLCRQCTPLPGWVTSTFLAANGNRTNALYRATLSTSQSLVVLEMNCGRSMGPGSCGTLTRWKMAGFVILSALKSGKSRRQSLTTTKRFAARQARRGMQNAGEIANATRKIANATHMRRNLSQMNRKTSLQEQEQEQLQSKNKNKSLLAPSASGCRTNVTRFSRRR
jgi:hypothetical protein